MDAWAGWWKGHGEHQRSIFDGVKKGSGGAADSISTRQQVGEGLIGRDGVMEDSYTVDLVCSALETSHSLSSLTSTSHYYWWKRVSVKTASSPSHPTAEPTPPPCAPPTCNFTEVSFFWHYKMALSTIAPHLIIQTPHQFRLFLFPLLSHGFYNYYDCCSATATDVFQLVASRFSFW